MDTDMKMNVIWILCIVLATIVLFELFSWELIADFWQTFRDTLGLPWNMGVLVM